MNRVFKVVLTGFIGACLFTSGYVLRTYHEYKDMDDCITEFLQDIPHGVKIAMMEKHYGHSVAGGLLYPHIESFTNSHAIKCYYKTKRKR